ncbi:MAG: hypothetical protein ACFFC7_30020 [Candidatus Hermodarchaeota archaeon]
MHKKARESDEEGTTPKKRWVTTFVWLGVVISGGIVLLVTPSLQLSANTWMHTYGGGENDYIHDMVARNNDELVVVGKINGSQLVGLSRRGGILWFHSPPHEKVMFYEVISTADGGLMAIGTIDNSSVTDLYLYRFDAPGFSGWTRVYGHPEERDAYLISGPIGIQTTDGGFVVAAFEDGVRRSLYGTWLIRLNSTGFPVWNVSYGYPQVVNPSTLLQLSDGAVVLAGDLWSETPGNDAIVLCFDLNGTSLWNRTYAYENSESEAISSLVQTNDGGLVLAGATHTYDAPADAWLIRTDSSGNILWERTYGGSNSERIFSLIQTSDERFVLAGVVVGEDTIDGWLICTDLEGQQLWNRTYGELETDSISTILPTDDGGFILAGTTYSFGAVKGDAWVFKTDPRGQFSQVPDLSGVLLLAGWGMSLGGALVLGITVADHILTSRKAKEPPPTNHEDTISQVP